MVMKVNRFGKAAERALVVTDKTIYKLEPPKFKPMKGGILLTTVRCLHSRKTRRPPEHLHSSCLDSLHALHS